MDISPASLDHAQAYKLVTGIVVPRPIAWVTTMNEDGSVNLAPFSAFTFVSTEPPMLGFNCGRRLGERKDTARNVLRTREFVVNIGDDSMLEAIHASSAELPPNVSEAAQLGLETVPGRVIATHRLADAPASMECRLERVLEFGISGAEFFVGEVVNFHVRDDLYLDGKIDTETLRPAARVGGPVYARLGEFVRLAPIPMSPRRAPDR
jgi:flavin reductase (DIM6/NTAB) family NADH-FMN oxidoreductase RutF